MVSDDSARRAGKESTPTVKVSGAGLSEVRVKTVFCLLVFALFFVFVLRVQFSLSVAVFSDEYALYN